MAKGNSKSEKRKQEKAKTEQNCYNNEKVESDYKHGEKVKKKQKLKRALPAEENSVDNDHVENDSIKKQKKRKKERDVETSELSDGVEDRYQAEGKVKEKGGKSRVKQQELAQTSSSVDDVCEEIKEKTCIDSGKEKKESGEYNHNKKKHRKHKHDKSSKEPEIDVGEKKKHKVQQGKNQEEDLQNISDRNDVDSEVGNKKKKKKRKREEELDNTIDVDEGNAKLSDNILGTGEELDCEEFETGAVKKKKKKTSKGQPGQESKPSTVHPGIDYLQTWHNEREHWKFKKVRQVWLLQNMFDQELISDENFKILLKYLEGLKGTAKDKTVEVAEQRLESGTEVSEQDAVVESRVQQVLQLLTE